MAKSSLLTPRKTPTKRKFSGKARKSKRFKKRGVSKKKFYKKLKKHNRGGRTINVAEDKEFANVIKRSQKVSNYQQKLINRRFKNGYSPFEKITTKQIQLTSDAEFNKCKWIWRVAADNSFVKTCFDNFPVDSNTVGGNNLGTTDIYVKSEEQSIYINKINMEYEIMNPTNYDITLVIYDIVYKEDLNKDVSVGYYESSSDSSLTGGNPIKLIDNGLKTRNINSTTYVLVSDPTQVAIDDIKCNPTMSYEFNIYCKILKKQIFRLQPGATMTHIFKYRPRALINLGYLGVKYNENNSGSMKNVTCGSLFKIYGQISGSGADSSKLQVANASGRIMIKETNTIKWYTMTPKYNYVFRDKTSEWAPSSGEKMEVVNDSAIKTIQEVDLDDTNN